MPSRTATSEASVSSNRSGFRCIRCNVAATRSGGYTFDVLGLRHGDFERQPERLVEHRVVRQVVEIRDDDRACFFSDQRWRRERRATMAASRRWRGRQARR